MLTIALALAAPHHQVRVALDPAAGRLEVVDRVENLGESQRFDFVLHAGLQPVVATKGWSLTKVSAVTDGPVPAERWSLVTKKKKPIFPIELRYAGELRHELATQGEEYQRSFSETPGIISDQGVYLAGSSAWLPSFGGDAITYDIEVALPDGWSAVGSGNPRACEGCAYAYTAPEPMDEAYLVAARFTRTSGEVAGERGPLGIDVYLREPDPGLAYRYTAATGRYLQLYESMLPPYPFERFALVENFWETGYGMPGFTLLGPQVIRFPWVLTSSYPHEILHTWWGNSASIDPAGGNWAEGLTAYMADHLFAEQKGQDAAYRRTTLQKFTDIAADQDFALVSFLGRTSAQTEAVGYGKSLMLWHMLRLRVGDEAFLKGLTAFHEDFRFRRAGFADLEPHLSKASGQDLKPIFEAWTTKPGALRLGLEGATAEKTATGWVVRANLTQSGAELPGYVPVFVTTAGARTAIERRVELTGKVSALEIEVPASAGEPLRIDVDPLYDAMRALDPREVAPALSTVFGEAEKVYVLPASAPEAEQAAWRELAATWAKPGEPKILLDRDLKAPPPGAWLLGWDNTHAPEVARRAAHAGPKLGKDGLTWGNETLGRGASIVLVARSDDPARAIGWVAAGEVAAIPGLARKLPHYTKYALLAFTGSAPDNTVKASFEPESSPLAAALGSGPLPPMGKPPARPPLAKMPPRFQAEALRAHAAWLADPAREGRQPGTPGMKASVDFVADALRATGIEPARQTWTAKVADRELELTNLIFEVPGQRPLPPVVVLAHLDHLGKGWPEARTGNAGKVHPGADDNASGVAVAIELAKALAGEPARPRPVVFVFTDAEEAGVVGAQKWAADAPVPFACLSLDTVGRLSDGKLTVVGSESAREWRGLFMGVGFTTGASFEFAQPATAASDHAACLAKGVPSVQLTTGANADYHAPTDTADKLDAAGMAAVAEAALEAVAYLAERTDPLTAQIGATAAATGEGRKASLGTMPDFAFPGPGVRVSDVMPGSAAQAAGLRAGDVVLRLGKTDIADLKGYSDALKSYAPGDEVEVRYARGGEQKTVKVKLTAR